jgi:hypothetical protein
MADPLLSSSDWPAVRAALDVTLDSNSLPDATIALDIFSGKAMREVEARVTDATTLTGDDETAVTNAAVFLTASFLAPSLPALTAGRGQFLNWQRKGMDWEQRARDLRAQAEDEIAGLLEPASTDAHRPTMFAVAKGRRGL